VIAKKTPLNNNVKDNNVIAKRKTGIGDRWKTRSHGDDLNVIVRQKQNWRHGGN
jgi:hypothetical protein